MRSEQVNSSKKAQNVLFSLVLVVLSSPGTRAQPPAAEALEAPLIPLPNIVGYPSNKQVRISPDGSQIAFLKTGPKGIGLRVKDLATGVVKKVPGCPKGSTKVLGWTGDGKNLILACDPDGREVVGLFIVRPGSEQIRLMVPARGRPRLIHISAKRPKELVVSLLNRRRLSQDLYRFRYGDHHIELISHNPGDVFEWLVDDDLELRAALALTPAGFVELRTRLAGQDTLAPVSATKGAERIELVGVDPDGCILWLDDATTDELVLKHLCSATGVTEIVFEEAGRDVSEVLRDRKTGQVLAVATDGQTKIWHVMGSKVGKTLDMLIERYGHTFSIVDQSADGMYWIVLANSDGTPPRYLQTGPVFDKPREIFPVLPGLENQRLARSEPIVIKARDGLDLVAFWTEPTWKPRGRTALVVLPHGGPFSRDRLEFDNHVQWLANRGYAVLRVNFRGSEGFGKAFFRAGFRRFGTGIQADIGDAVEWAIANRRIDPDRIAILGASFGGYSALMQSALHPERYKAAAS